MPSPVVRLELTSPKPCTSATAQVHGPLSTEALNPSWVRSSVADCSASGTSMAVRLWSTEKPTLTPGAMRAPIPATPPQVWRRSPTKSPIALLVADIPYPSNQVRYRGASDASEGPPPPGVFRNMRLKPLVDWLPSRSRKLLPRLVTVAPADKLELIIVGVGLGDG